ncbi:MAG: hypothetical protein AB1801_20615 [Chloroflexota bacterium]
MCVVSTDGTWLGDVGTARQPDYSSDGAQLLVNGDGGGLDKLRTSDPIGGNGNWREIGDPGLAGHSHPAWSPDGTQVIYDDNTIGGADWHIFRRDLTSITGPGEEMAATGGPITGANPLHPLWATGDRFIFRGCQTWAGQGGICGLWLMQGQRGDPQKLTDNFRHIPTDVHGETIVYVSDETGDWNVHTLNIATKATRQLTFDQAADALATISPDGQTVAFLSNQGGSLAVWHVDINGGDSKKMFDIPANWGALRSDGWAEERLSWGP